MVLLNPKVFLVWLLQLANLGGMGNLDQMVSAQDMVKMSSLVTSWFSRITL